MRAWQRHETSPHPRQIMTGIGVVVSDCESSEPSVKKAEEVTPGTRHSNWHNN